MHTAPDVPPAALPTAQFGKNRRRSSAALPQKKSITPPEQKEPVSLKEIVQEMQIIAETMTVYFQRSTGKFFTGTDEYLYAAESDDPLEGRPEWEQEIIRETAEFLPREDDGDHVPLPTRYDIHEYAIMERFCSIVESRKIAKDLFRCLTGKGASAGSKRHSLGMASRSTCTRMERTWKSPGSGARSTALTKETGWNFAPLQLQSGTAQGGVDRNCRTVNCQ